MLSRVARIILMKPFNEYKRFFAFGCSLTKYYWPTWADIIASEISEYYNYAQTGGGNLFISNSIVEANLTHKFNENDLVIVMWSSISREDRYKNRKWETPGNIYTQGVIDMDFVHKWYDDRFYLMRDLAIVEQSSAYLKSLTCDTDMLKMVDFEETKTSDSIKGNHLEDILKLYSTTLEKVKPSIVDVVYQGTWPVIPIRGWGGGGQTADYHPTPNGHLRYLEEFYTVTNKMKQFANEFDEQVLKCKTLDDTLKFWCPPGVSRL
jgi:hypothetical protein